MEMLCPDCMSPMVSPDGQTANCPNHPGGYRILFTRYPTVAPAQRARAGYAPAPAPVSTVAVSGMPPGMPPPPLAAPTADDYAARLAGAYGAPALPAANCVKHPTAPAVTNCQTCRAPVCATCVFVFPGGIQLCPDCASNPVPAMSPRRKRLMWWSIGLAIWCVLTMVVMVIVIRQSNDPKEAEAIGGVMSLLSMIPSLIGLGLGVATFDRRMTTPGIAWIGVVGNGLVLGIWLLFIVIGLMR